MSGDIRDVRMTLLIRKSGLTIIELELELEIERGLSNDPPPNPWGD